MAQSRLQLADGGQLAQESDGVLGRVQDTLHASVGLVAGGCFALYLAYLGMRSEFANPKSRS